jgi:hypothetical protein
MEIVIFGGFHDGLDHRERFQDELKREIRERGSDPTFVAVEWGEEVYRALTAERDWLKGRLRERWPEADDEVVRLAGDSLCWEADAHVGVVAAETPTVYLDGLLERELDAWAIGDPKECLAATKSAPLITTISTEASKSVEAAIAASNSCAWGEIEAKMPDRRDRERREPAWASAIADRVGDDEDGWAAVIVGAAHGTRFDRYSLPCQLDERGVRSKSVYLSKPPWADQEHCDRD